MVDGHYAWSSHCPSKKLLIFLPAADTSRTFSRFSFESKGYLCWRYHECAVRDPPPDRFFQLWIRELYYEVALFHD